MGGSVIEWLAPVGSTVSVAWYLWLLGLGIILMTRRIPATRRAAGRRGASARGE